MIEPLPEIVKLLFLRTLKVYRLPVSVGSNFKTLPFLNTKFDFEWQVVIVAVLMFELMAVTEPLLKEPSSSVSVVASTADTTFQMVRPSAVVPFAIDA